MSEATKHDDSLQQKPCPICGGTDFRWGGVGIGNSYGPIFTEDSKGQGFFDQPRRAKLIVRECSACGNVQWFTREGI